MGLVLGACGSRLGAGALERSKKPRSASTGAAQSCTLLSWPEDKGCFTAPGAADGWGRGGPRLSPLGRLSFLAPTKSCWGSAARKPYGAAWLFNPRIDGIEWIELIEFIELQLYRIYRIDRIYGHHKEQSEGLTRVLFKTCEASLVGFAHLLLYEWNNVLHFHPPSSIYLFWSMMGKGAILDIPCFLGVSKVLVFSVTSLNS